MKIENFIQFTSLSEEERNKTLAGMSEADITASIADATTKATAVFATEPSERTVALADEADATVASLNMLEGEQARREKVAQEAADRFAAAQAKFATASATAEVSEDDSDDEDEDDDSEDGDDDSDDEDGDDDSDDEDDADSEDEGEVEAAAKKKANPFDKSKDKEDATQTASNPLLSRRLPAARSTGRKVGKRTKRPEVAASNKVTITAAANVEGFGAGQPIEGMHSVAEAVLSVAKSLPRFNRSAQRQAHEANGGKPVLHKTSTASFNVDVAPALTASPKEKDGSHDHSVIKAAVKEHTDRISLAMRGGNDAVTTAAMAWCSPSEVMYNWIADFVVDGLITTPEVAAPRGGLMLTEGPRLLQGTYDDSEVDTINASSYDDADEVYGFGGTEEEMEAGYIKTCETIECPEWQDHRLDFTGYCWKIPLLTEATFPELVADAMRVADVAFAHKMNRRKIGDIRRGSTPIDATSALGGTMLDTLEAFTQVAIKERRWWNLGENATMEVKLPQVAKYIFQFDMARRSGLALSDTATEQKVAAHFAAYNLSVEYLSDYQQVYGSATPTAAWPETIEGMMYPVGTWLTSVKPVVNLSTIYDAASLSENEYTGVFFEQGLMTLRRGYRSHRITVPVCVAGRTGANDLTCLGFDVPEFDGSI